MNYKITIIKVLWLCIFEDFCLKKMLDIDLQNWIHFFPGHPVYETLFSLKNSAYDHRNTVQTITNVNLHISIVTMRRCKIIFLELQLYKKFLPKT